jgi:hypothetical protein
MPKAEQIDIFQTFIQVLLSALVAFAGSPIALYQNV